MEKNEIMLSFDSEKMEALVFYLKKENTNVQHKMDEALRITRRLYRNRCGSIWTPSPRLSVPGVRHAPVNPRRRRPNQRPIPQAAERGLTYERRCAVGAMASRI